MVKECLLEALTREADRDWHTLRNPVTIPPTERLRVIVGQWMARAVEQVQRNHRRTRDNQRIRELNSVVERHPEE